jgi:hypothetical protein
MARLIAASDLILTARLPSDAAAIVAVAKESSYVSLPLEAPIIIKGTARARLALRLYVDRKSAFSANEALAAVSGGPATLFLVLADDVLYLASKPESAIRGGDVATMRAVRAELMRQTAILSHWQIDQDLPHFDEVGRLMQSLGSGTARQQHETFAALEKLGMAAAPAIVAQMDNRRPLVEQQISLVNHGRDAFEGIRHYGPEQVVDALAAILNQITGASFGFIYNGGSDDERRAVVDAWRVYAADLPCARIGTD